MNKLWNVKLCISKLIADTIIFLRPSFHVIQFKYAKMYWESEMIIYFFILFFFHFQVIPIPNMYCQFFFWEKYCQLILKTTAWFYSEVQGLTVHSTWISVTHLSPLVWLVVKRVCIDCRKNYEDTSNNTHLISQHI